MSVYKEASMKNIEIRRFAPLSYAGQEAINTLCTNLTFSGENMKRIMEEVKRVGRY